MVEIARKEVPQMAAVADVVRTQQSEILAEWTREASRAAAARGLSGPEISNIMPAFLDSLVELRPDGVLTTESRRTVEGHVRSRLRHGFSLPEIVEEFALLGRCIQRATINAGATPDASETEQLFATLHNASLLVTELYTRQLLDDEQTEKLYLRRIRASVAGDMQQGLAISEQLRGVVAIIMEAMHACCAVVAVHDFDTQALIGAAPAGPAGDRLRTFILEGDQRFLADNRPRREPVEDAVADVVLEGGEELRSVGVKALLGVRIVTHVGSLGSIHIGITEDRSFTARELSQLEAFGLWLTLHLDNARLFEDLKHQVRELKEERQLRERFVSILAHDLRGPLSAAKLVAHLLQRGTHSVEKQQELVGRIDKSLDRSERMVHDLLDANRVHAGQRLSLTVNECKLNDVVRDVADELTSQHGARFVLDVEPNVIGFWSAEDLRRALWNLGVNAVKYGAADAPITLRLHRTPLGVRLAVHNFGKPIPKDELPFLFRAYARTRASEAGGKQGWGLGLALVLGCAEAHGGTVTVESEASAGTEFRMDLPADSRPFQPQTPDAAEAAAVH